MKEFIKIRRFSEHYFEICRIIIGSCTERITVLERHHDYAQARVRAAEIREAWRSQKTQRSV